MKIVDKICVGFYKAGNVIGDWLLAALGLTIMIADGALVVSIPIIVFRYFLELSWCFSIIATLVTLSSIAFIFLLVKIYERGESIELGLDNMEDEEAFKELSKAFAEYAATISKEEDE